MCGAECDLISSTHYLILLFHVTVLTAEKKSYIRRYHHNDEMHRVEPIQGMGDKYVDNFPRRTLISVSLKRSIIVSGDSLEQKTIGLHTFSISNKWDAKLKVGSCVNRRV